MLTFANARETLTCLEVTRVLEIWRTALGVTLVGWLVEHSWELAHLHMICLTASW